MNDYEGIIHHNQFVNCIINEGDRTDNKEKKLCVICHNRSTRAYLYKDDIYCTEKCLIRKEFPM